MFQDKLYQPTPQQIGTSSNTNQFLFQNFEEPKKVSNTIQMYQQKNHYIQESETILIPKPTKCEQKLPSLNEVFGYNFVESTKPKFNEKITGNCFSLSEYKL